MYSVFLNTAVSLYEVKFKRRVLMKKKLVAILFSIAITAGSMSFAAKTTTSSDLAEAIRLYKAGNYSQCYLKLDTAIKNSPANPLCYYYKAMTAAQIGKKDEAISNYEKTLALASENSKLARYASKGKRCLEDPEKCQEAVDEDPDEKFIRGSSSSGFSEEARSMFERLKIEQMMRDMNRNDDINPQKFREYKDFSSMNTPSEMPNDAEIVAAIRTLQKAGMMDFRKDMYSDLSLLTGSQNDVSLLNMMNNGNLNPQLIQAMFANNMSLGF